MKKKQGVSFCVAIITFLAFIVWTVLVRVVDVAPVGPQGSSVGFSTFNVFVRELTGFHAELYVITDWLGCVPICVAAGFAILGLVQLITRKSIKKVDKSIIILGFFYIVVIALYFLFEFVVINYRPVLIEGMLEASYPSSTTMLVMFVMPTALMQFNSCIKKRFIKICVLVVVMIYTAFMVICRLLSGVHWITDIIGGAFISTSLVSAYSFLTHISILFESRYAQ